MCLKGEDMDKKLAEEIRTLIREEMRQSATGFTDDGQEELFRRRVVEQLTDQVLRRAQRILSWFGIVSVVIVSSFFQLQIHHELKNARLSVEISQASYNSTLKELRNTYERVDRPRGEFFHTNWTGRGGSTAASTYTV